MRRMPVESSSLAAVGYEAATQRLEVEFVSGRVYRYSGVPEFLFRALLAARSKGRYFNQSIRDRFPHEEFDPP